MPYETLEGVLTYLAPGGGGGWTGFIHQEFTLGLEGLL